MGRTRATLTIDDVVGINRRMVALYGGFNPAQDDNFANRPSLEFVLDEMDVVLFGEERYPTVYHKAAILAWRIITDHVFRDGNKRTAMMCCLVYLELNGYRIHLDRPMLDMAVDIADHQISFEEFVDWIKDHTHPAI